MKRAAPLVDTLIGVTLLRVWWTISGSDVAWEWSPDDAVVRAGRLVPAGGAVRFAGTEEWAPMWTSARTRAGFQALKDLTALFAEEANVLPGDVRIFWIARDRAVSWCRDTGALSWHEVTPGAALIEVPGAAFTVEGRGTADDLRAADARAHAALQN